MEAEPCLWAAAADGRTIKKTNASDLRAAGSLLSAPGLSCAYPGLDLPAPPDAAVRLGRPAQDVPLSVPPQPRPGSAN